MNLNLKGRNALVGGSSKGIGRAVAIELSRAGASITLVGRNSESLSITLKDLIHSPDQDHDFMVVDQTDIEDLNKKVKGLVVSKPIHILVNNTGGPPGGPVTEAQTHEFLSAFQQHVVASHVLMKAVLPAMKESHYGRIINIISISVKEPIEDLGVSNTIRAAMASWAKSLANETGPFGITVNNVLPGFTLTDRLEELADLSAEKWGIPKSEVIEKWKRATPMGRLGSPAEIANAVVFLASPSASFITGINLPVDGGRIKSL